MKPEPSEAQQRALRLRGRSWLGPHSPAGAAQGFRPENPGLRQPFFGGPVIDAVGGLGKLMGGVQMGGGEGGSWQGDKTPWKTLREMTAPSNNLSNNLVLMWRPSRLHVICIQAK